MASLPTQELRWFVTVSPMPRADRGIAGGSWSAIDGQSVEANTSFGGLCTLVGDVFTTVYSSVT